MPSRSAQRCLRLASPLRAVSGVPGGLLLLEPHSALEKITSSCPVWKPAANLSLPSLPPLGPLLSPNQGPHSPPLRGRALPVRHPAPQHLPSRAPPLLLPLPVQWPSEPQPV